MAKLTQKQERFYVYELIDSRTNEVFYVGKGQGIRLKHHVRDAKAGRINNVHKHRRIVEILESGCRVIEQIVGWFESESDALDFERDRIANLGDQLVNISGGAMSAESHASELAKLALSRLKPFDEWMATTSDCAHRALQGDLESPRAGYDDHVAFLQLVAGLR